VDHLFCLFSCAFKVRYNEFDVTLPVVKRVQYLVRKIRDIIAQDSETRKSEVTPVMEKEIKDDTSKYSAPAKDKTTSDFLRRVLKSDSFFSPDMQNIPAQTSEFGDSASSDPDSSTKETKKKTWKKKMELPDVQVDSTVAATTGNTSSELASPDTGVKEVKTRSRKKRTESSDPRVDSSSAAESSNTVSEPSTSASADTEVKTRGRRKKTNSTASEEIAQS